MLIDILLSVGVMMLKALNALLSLFQLPYISNMTDAITWFFGLMIPFQGVVPLDTLFQCMFVLLLCYLFRFQIRFLLETVLPLIPFIGKRIHLPHPLYANHDGSEEIAYHARFKKTMRGPDRIHSR